MKNLSAVNVTLREMTALGRLEKIDAAWVQALRSMASALDYDPQNASLWRQYRSALAELLEADRDADSGLAAALAEIGSATEVGDSPPS